MSSHHNHEHSHTHHHHHHGGQPVRQGATPIQALSFLRVSAVMRLSAAVIIAAFLWAATWAVLG